MRRLAGVLAVIAVLLPGAAGGAPSALPQPRALLGGGSIPKVHDPKLFGLHFVTMRIGVDGTSLTFYGDWSQRCSGYRGAVTGTFVVDLVRIAPNGRFSATGDIKTQSPTMRGPFRLAGRFTSPTSAAGTGSLTTEWRPGDGKTYSCRTGRIAWQARATSRLGSPEGKPVPKKGAVYYGNTSQYLPVVVRVSPNGKEVANAAVLWDAECRESKNGLGLLSSTPAHPIRRGVAARVERYPVQTGYAPGQVTQVVSSHKARFGSEAVAGTWTVIADVEDRNGRPVDKCRSGTIRWKAVR